MLESWSGVFPAVLTFANCFAAHWILTFGPGTLSAPTVLMSDLGIVFCVLLLPGPSFLILQTSRYDRGVERPLVVPLVIGWQVFRLIY